MDRSEERVDALAAFHGIRELCHAIVGIVAAFQVEHDLDPSVGLRLEQIADEARHVSELCRETSGEALGAEPGDPTLLTGTRRALARVDEILTGAVAGRIGARPSTTAQVATPRAGAAGTDPGEVRALVGALAARPGIISAIGGEPQRVLTADRMADSLLRQARIAGEARASIWEHEMLESGAAAVALGAKLGNREKVRAYRDRSWLIGLPHGRGFLYPRFQFDIATRDVFAEVRVVNELLRASTDPWGVASWWISVSDRVGCAPLALVGTDRGDESVRAAKALLEPVG